MKIQPYVFFDGRADEAIEFYKTALGAKVVMITRFKECPVPMPNMDPAMADKVMHCTLSIGETEVLVSDGRCIGEAKFEGFGLCVNVKTDDEAKHFFAALADGGNVTMPLGKSFFSSNFGMITDRFGVSWMVIVQ